MGDRFILVNGLRVHHGGGSSIPFCLQPGSIERQMLLFNSISPFSFLFTLGPWLVGCPFSLLLIPLWKHPGGTPKSMPPGWFQILLLTINFNNTVVLLYFPQTQNLVYTQKSYHRTLKLVLDSTVNEFLSYIKQMFFLLILKKQPIGGLIDLMVL